MYFGYWFRCDIKCNDLFVFIIDFDSLSLSFYDLVNLWLVEIFQLHFDFFLVFVIFTTLIDRFVLTYSENLTTFTEAREYHVAIFVDSCKLLRQLPSEGKRFNVYLQHWPILTLLSENCKISNLSDIVIQCCFWRLTNAAVTAWHPIVNGLTNSDLPRKLDDLLVIVHFYLLSYQWLIGESLVIDALFKEFVEIKVVLHQKC